VLRALAARRLLQLRKFLRCRAAGKPVIRACRSENDMLRHQVADKTDFGAWDLNGRCQHPINLTKWWLRFVHLAGASLL